MNDEQVQNVTARAKDLMAGILGELTEAVPDGKPDERRIKQSEWPDPAFVDIGVRGDLSELEGLRWSDREVFSGETAEVKFIDAVAGVMNRRMETDDRIVVLGEDIHRLNGGTNGATRGLKDRFPDRIHQGPRSVRTRSRGSVAAYGARWSLSAGHRVHVCGLHVGGRRSVVQSNR